MTLLAHAGYLVDARTGEVARRLDTDRRCRTCSKSIHRTGSTGRQPAHCRPCQTTRRRTADTERKRRHRKIVDELRAELDAWTASGDSEAAGYALFVRLAEYADAHNLDDGERLPLVIDHVPRGWYMNEGPDEGSTLAPGSDTYALIYGPGGLRERALTDPWLSERADWRHGVNDPAR